MEPLDDTSSAVPTVTALDATHTGVWRVHTRSSVHEFDLDRRTYRRCPGPMGSAFDHDGATVSLTRVERWPVVGGSFFVWFDDPRHPEQIEHWRQSSTIMRIERDRRDEATSQSS